MSTLTRTTERPPRTVEPSIRPLTQADVDASLRRAHKASRGRAYAAGCLVVVETTRYEDGRSLQTRLLLGEARALREALAAAIAEAEEAQARHDLRFIAHEPLVKGGQGRTGAEVTSGGLSVLACVAVAVVGIGLAGALGAWGLA